MKHSKVVGIRMDDTKVNELEKMAEKDGRSFSNLVKWLIDLGIKQHGKEKK